MAATALPAFAMPSADGWEAVLEERLSEPRGSDGVRTFDYAGFTADAEDRAALDAYIAALSEAGEPEDDAEAAAYWANLYNALTIEVIADNYPVKSIRDIKSGLFSIGPWKKDVVTVAGEGELSLDNIEHDILRKRYPSPHVHYMVNCASVGCPNLQPKLWQGATLDADREAAAREFIASPRGVRVDGNGRVTVSSIYKWFEEDFGGSKSGVIDHIKAYADSYKQTGLMDRTKYDDHGYDWSLNGG